MFFKFVPAEATSSNKMSIMQGSQILQIRKYEQGAWKNQHQMLRNRKGKSPGLCGLMVPPVIFSVELSAMWRALVDDLCSIWLVLVRRGMPVQDWCPGDSVTGFVLRGLAVPGGWVTGPPTVWWHYSVFMGGRGSGTRCNPSRVWTDTRVSMIAWAGVEIA